MNAAPITADEFAAIMQRLGPFEKKPIIAAGISGGADSMALLHLAHAWVQMRGGRVVAFTVNHNIRSESADEAMQVGAWAAALDVEHTILKWNNPYAAASALQQRARQARHELLAQAAASRGILHLVIAHHQDDQAETVLLRLAKGSGPDGLAGMNAIMHKPQIRVLRPLLGFAKGRLKATCELRGQEWIDDPSNFLPRFARPRLRAVSEALAEEGLTTHHLALTAAASGRTRAALERASAALLARCSRIMPQGYAELMLGHDDHEVQLRALAELLQTIGGGEYQTNIASLDEILKNPQRLSTLGSCLVEQTHDKFLIVRENRNIEPEQIVKPKQLEQWDRFKIWAKESCIIGALGDRLPGDAQTDLPKAVLVSQPAFRRDGLITAIPTIGYCADQSQLNHYKAWFSPKVSSGKADFTIV